MLGPPPESVVEVAPGLDYYYHLRDRLKEVHEQAREALQAAGMKQKHAYDTRCAGQDFTSGD